MRQYSLTCSKCHLDLILKTGNDVNSEISCKKCNIPIFIKDLEFTISNSLYDNKHIKITEVLPEKPNKYPLINGYQILKQIGQGGMGEVFLAQKDSNKIIFKFLHLETSQNKQIMRYFIREAQIMQELSHRYIAQFIGCGNFEGRAYYCMEYIEGIDLSEQIRIKGKISLIDSLKIVYHISAALNYGLKKNVIHRDLKPQNIMLQSDDLTKPKIIDFGLAKSLRDHYSEITKTGSIMGTPYYMAPEQIEDSKHVDHRADIYALGATLYHMLSGKRPFYELQQKNIHDILETIKKRRPTPISSLVPSCPEEVIAIVEKSMAVNLSERYQTPEEMRVDIKRFINRYFV